MQVPSPAHLVGAFFRPPAQRVLAELASGCPLILRPEPENPYDPNAVAVLLANEHLPTEEDFLENLSAFGIDIEDYNDLPFLHLGYIEKGRASEFHSFSQGKLIFSSAGKPMVQVA